MTQLTDQQGDAPTLGVYDPEQEEPLLEISVERVVVDGLPRVVVQITEFDNDLPVDIALDRNH